MGAAQKALPIARRDIGFFDFEQSFHGGHTLLSSLKLTTPRPEAPGFSLLDNQEVTNLAGLAKRLRLIGRSAKPLFLTPRKVEVALVIGCFQKL